MSYPSPLQIETKSTAKPFSFFIGETQVQDLRREVLEQINEYQRQNVMFLTSEQKEKLEDIACNTLEFNRKTKRRCNNDRLDLCVTADDLFAVAKLRANVYKTMPGYKEEFGTFPFLMLDPNDKRAAIVMTRKDNQIVGTMRTVYDSPAEGLPSEDKKISFGYQREIFKQIAENGRLAIDTKVQGKGLDFFLLNAQIRQIGKETDLKAFVFVVRSDRENDQTKTRDYTDHTKLYLPFGGVQVDNYIEGYGSLNQRSAVMSWRLDATPSRLFTRKAGAFERENNEEIYKKAA